MERDEIRERFANYDYEELFICGSWRELGKEGDNEKCISARFPRGEPTKLERLRSLREEERIFRNGSFNGNEISF